MLNIDIVLNLVILFPEQFQNGQFEKIWWAQDGAPAYGGVAVTERICKYFTTG